MSYSMVESQFPTTGHAERDYSRSLQSTNVLQQRCRSIAAERLTAGVVSSYFSVNDLMSPKMSDPPKEVRMGLNERGLLHILSSDSSKVCQNFPALSPDIHSCNIQVEMIKTDTEGNGGGMMFFLKMIKTVERGGELLLWFSEDILALIDMPFLTPRNITGHKKYSCHICSKTFEFPNPLKLHILLSCERESTAQLWQKIGKCIRKQHKPNSMMFNIRVADLYPTTDQERPNSVNISPVFSINDHNSRCISEPPVSAFLPYRKQTIATSKMETFKQTLPTRQQFTSNIPLNLTTNQLQRNTNLEIDNRLQYPLINNILELRLSRSLEELSSNYAADVELFASNWGKMKQGHLCVYCGKVYSRKYGLKIHIRTHTGYKPLKCKFCQRPFGDPSNLNKHVRLHASGHTPYMCSLCGKVLVRRRDLERHMKSQHGSDEHYSSDDNIDIDDE